MHRPDLVLNLLLAAAAALYLAAWLLLLRGRRRSGYGTFAAGWAVNLVLVGVNAALAKGPPLGNMYHVQVVLALCFGPLFAVQAARSKLAWTGVYFALVSALPLVGALFMSKDVGWRRMPALQSPWFVPHVAAYMLSYALAGVAFGLALVGRAKGRRLGLEDAGRYDRACLETLRLAFPFMTFGMLSGALWAEEAWGAYWSWDPKETWSLITWMLYVIYFHCCADRRLSRYAMPAQVLAFAALLTTFFLVNLWPKLASVLHGYA